MTPANPQPTERPARILLWTGTVATCLGAFGFLMGPRIGGFGPSLFWLGLFASLGAFALRAVVSRLRPDQQTVLDPPFAGLVVSLQVGILALVALELVSTAKSPLPETVWVNPAELLGVQRPHPQLGWAPAKNHVSILEFPESPIEMKLNSRGFRDIEQARDANRPCVVILGDSFPLGWGSEYDDSVAPRLRGVLPEAQVFNASWAGYTLDQIAQSYTALARPLHPDVVLVMFMARPGVDDSLPLYRGMRKSWMVLRDGKLETRGLPIGFATTEESNKELYRSWEAARITGPRAAFRFLCREFPRRYLSAGRRLFPDFDWHRIQRDGLPGLNALHAAILSDLQRQVEADGAKMIVVIAPSVEIYDGSRRPVEAMASYIASYRSIGIEPLDLTSFLATDWQSCHNQMSHPNGKAVDRIRHDLARRVRAALRR
jgi:hypothetical protein